MTASRARFQQKMVAHVLRLAPDEGYNRTELADVRLLRANASLPHTPVLYEPCIMIVCQGRKRGFLGRHTYLYDAQHYLVLSVPLPFISQTEATKKEPLLALSIRLDLTMLADLLLALERATRARCDAGQHGIDGDGRRISRHGVTALARTRTPT